LHIQQKNWKLSIDMLKNMLYISNELKDNSYLLIIDLFGLTIFRIIDPAREFSKQDLSKIKEAKGRYISTDILIKAILDKKIPDKKIIDDNPDNILISAAFVLAESYIKRKKKQL